MKCKDRGLTLRQIVIARDGEEAWLKKSHAERRHDGKRFYQSGAYCEQGYEVALRCRNGRPQTYRHAPSLPR
jgi:hypothetical protein